VVTVPGFSKELCGGIHVDRSGEIGSLKIISESSLAAGIRRLVAVTGDGISKLLTKQNHIIRELRGALKCSEEEILSRLQSLLADRKNLEDENKRLKLSTMTDQVDDLIAGAHTLGDLRLVVHKVDDPGDLKELGDQFRQAFRSRGISLIGTVQQDKPMILCAVTDDLTDQIQAGKIVKEIGDIMGGGGGGNLHIATAGGSDVNLLQDALDYGKNLIESIFSDN
jgi:alanyl-tRNA synthetase